MAQRYGLRASNNLSEVIDNDECLDNLSIDRRDLQILAGTASAGVTANDYQAIVGLTASLEEQLVAASGLAATRLAEMQVKASALGDTFTGNVSGSTVNNDRPYVTTSGTIIGPSTASYFSPAASGLFSTGGEYKLGPVTASTITSSGLNYTGTTAEWNNRFIESNIAVRVQEQPSWTNRQVPLFLPPPNVLDGCVLWLDTEFSDVALRSDGTSRLVGWKGVDGGAEAAQAFEGSQPLWALNVLGGKPAVTFDIGNNQFLFLGDLGYLVPSGATMVLRTTIRDNDYNIFSTLNNTANAWNNSTGSGDFGAFTTTRQLSFPSGAVSSGTHTFAIRASQSYGLEVRRGGTRQDYKASGFTYTGGDTWVLANGTNSSTLGKFFAGDIFAVAVFDKVLGDKEVRTVEEYFTRRYS